MDCPLCNKKMEKIKHEYSYGDILLGKFDAKKCLKCKEVFFTEEASDKIDEKAKELGLWGLGSKNKIGYSGNALIVRIPKKIADFLNLKKGEDVYIHPEGKHRLVVEA